ncbi:hypothetical protein Tco_1370688 [Tanacetum coccineum]
MNGHRTLQFHFKYLSLVLQDFGDAGSTFPITLFKDMDKLEKHLIAEKLHENDCKIASTALRTMLEKIFNSKMINFWNFNFKKYTGMETQPFKDVMIGDMDFIEKYMLKTMLHEQEIHKLFTVKKFQTQEVQINTVQALNVDSVFMENTCAGKEYCSSETAFSKSMKESSLD